MVSACDFEKAQICAFTQREDTPTACGLPKVYAHHFHYQLTDSLLSDADHAPQNHCKFLLAVMQPSFPFTNLSTFTHVG
jgi:hypothetical protein